MRWLVPTLLAALAPGCFYMDPINERPSAEIVRETPGVPHRGDQAGVAAKWSDPNGDDVTFSWSVYACSAGGASCDAAPYETGTQETFVTTVPAQRGGGAPLASIVFVLDVADSHGAIARPGQQLVLDVLDQAPSVALAADGRLWPAVGGRYPVTLPIVVRATKMDPDNAVGDTTGLSLTWDVPSATGSDPNKVGWTRLPDDVDRSEKYELVPDVPGTWTVHVTATDGQGLTGDETLTLIVGEDQPPCLGATDPGLAVGTIALDQARRFAVLTVDDDIDVYPAPPAGSPLGATTFHWSLASPHTGGVMTALGTDANNVVIDPGPYKSGDVLDLRVEIGDATPRTISCDPSTPTCSIGGVPTCLQRQTWHLEIP